MNENEFKKEEIERAKKYSEELEETETAMMFYFSIACGLFVGILAYMQGRKDGRRLSH